MKNKLFLIIGLIIALGLIVNIVFSVSIFLQQEVTKDDVKILDTRLIVLEDSHDIVPDKTVAEVPEKPMPEYGKLIKVTRVVDGDTIQLENGERLRYIGIDTPEKNDPRKPVQCFAEQASQKNKELVEGKMIKFYKDVNVRDKYQRLLGFVYLEDGTFVNLELVQQGYAFSYTYPPDISKQNEFTEAQKQARESKLGLWNDCTISTSTSGHEQTNAINEMK